MLLLLIGLLAHGWPRRHYSEAEIVSRAELIVVAKLREESLQLVPHVSLVGAGASWEHHVRLAISEFLKGTNTSQSLEASIHYGLDPIVGGFSSNQFGRIVITNITTYTNYPKDMVQLFDTGDSAGIHPISGDLRTNHIWLLRRTTVGGNSSLIGIHDPEDIQPIAKRDDLVRIVASQK